jgi:outer membrane immunogenic protein
MKRILLAGVAVAFCGATALAADLPVKASVAAPAALFNWSGCYAGGNIGYSWGRSKVSFPDDPLDFEPARTVDPKGVIGGLQGGCNWQVSRNWVWGVETDFQWSGQKGRSDETVVNLVIPGTVTILETDTVTSRLRWLGTLRGRLGFVADARPDVLWFATGGLAYGRIRTSANEDLFIDVGGGSVTVTETFSASENKTKFGVAVGGGFEVALGNNWTWKVEYLYVDLGTARGTANWSGVVTVCTPTCGGPIPSTSTGSYSNRMTDNIVRIGLNYRFGGDPWGKAPVAARY